MSIDRIAGNGGTYFLEVSTAHTSKTFSMLQINTDAVFTTLSLTATDGTVTNAITSMNLSARTVSQGSLLTAPQGSWFSAVTMSSGTAIGVITRNK